MDYMTINSIMLALILPFHDSRDIEIQNVYAKFTISHCIDASSVVTSTYMQGIKLKYCDKQSLTFPDQSKKDTFKLSLEKIK